MQPLMRVCSSAAAALPSQVRDRLYETRQILQMQLSGAAPDSLLSANPYEQTHELMEPLLMLYESLIATGDEAIANGHLLDIIRQARAALRRQRRPPVALARGSNWILSPSALTGTAALSRSARR